MYLTVHITTLQLQTTFPKPLYTTFCMYPSGPWLLKILMFALLVTGEIATYSWPWVCCWYWYQNLGGGPPPPRAGHAFPRQWHMRREGGLFISARVWCHPWMDDGMDGWMDGKLHEKRPWRPLLYVILVPHLMEHGIWFWVQFLLWNRFQISDLVLVWFGSC